MYTIEITPSAWNQLAHLSVDIYRRIREELEAIAVTLTHGHAHGLSTPREANGPDRSPVVVGDTVAHYDVDHAHRRVRLLEVVRGPSPER